MRKKIIFRIALFPIMIFGGLLISAYYLVATETGSIWLVEKSANYFPKSVAIDGMQGRLIDDFLIQKIQITHCENVSELNNLHVRWNARKLIDKVIEVHSITLDSANFNLAKQCQEINDTEIPEKITLPIEVIAHAVELNDISIKSQNDQFIKKIQGSVFLQNGGYELKDMIVDAPQYHVEGFMQGELKKPFASLADIKWHFNANKSDVEHAAWQGELAVKGDINSVQAEHLLHQPMQITSQVTLTDLLDNLKINVTNSWSAIILPLEKSAQLELTNGELLIDGNFDKINYALITTLKSKQLPSIAGVELKGVANKELVSISKLQVNSKQGSLTGSGDINLAPEINVVFSMQGNNINPEFFVAEMPGNIDFNTSIVASKSDQKLKATIDLESLSGMLRDFKVKGDGKLNYSQDRIEAQHFNLAVGDNKIHVNGLLGVENNMANFEIVANNLTQLHPSFAGNIQGQGGLEGSIKAPVIKVVLAGEDITFAQQLSLDNISINSDIHLFSDHQSNAEIQARKIIFNKTAIDVLSIDAIGNQKKHQIDFSLAGNDINSNLKLTGAYNNNEWLGRLNDMQIKTSTYGDWSQIRNTELNYVKKSFMINELCVVNEKSTMCAEGKINSKGGWQARGNLTNLPLNLLAKNVSQDIVVDGKGSMIFDLTGNAAGLSGEVKAFTKDTILSSAFNEEQEETLQIQQFEVAGDLQPKSSRFDLNLMMDKGHASGFAVIEKIHDVDKAYINKASFNAEIPKIDFLNIFVPNILVKEGNIKAQAELQGLIKKPKVNTDIKLSELKFYIPDLGTEYVNGELSLSSSDLSSFNLKGGLRSQDGAVIVDGKIESNETLTYEIDLKGESFQVLNLPDKNLMLSPVINISGSASEIIIDGVVEIPNAKLVLNELPKGTVSISNDQVFVSELDEEIESENKNNISVTGKIQLKLGDKVHFAGKGIQTDLTGDLLVRLDKKRTPVGQGVLQFKNASYAVLGQTLNISNGKMIFEGPINNPNLDVKVKREVEAVTAGIQISGTVQKPKTNVFSTPVMSDGNALSYLISGKPLAEASGSQNALLAKAALSLGVDGSASLTRQIASTVGLDEVGFGGGDDGLESTSLILGKYLSPKLYISYAYGLFSSVGTVGLDYQLSKTISVEAESGEAQAIDLIYTIERD